MKQAKPMLWGAGLSMVGIVGILIAHWMVFFWVPTEARQGVIQRIFYIHVPAAWLTELAFGITALSSCVYLWLRDERADAAALASAEGGVYLGALLLVVGPLWGRVAWGTYWTWDPRLTFTLLLWAIFLGYLLVRRSTADPERGRRLAAIVAIVGAMDIPIIHMSVYWFRSLHPEPVVLRQEGPTADSAMLLTLFVSLIAFSFLFLGLLYIRYTVEMAERAWIRRSHTEKAPV